MKQGADKHRITENSEILSLFQDSGSYQPDAAEVNGKEFKVTIPRTIPNGSLKDRNTTQKDSLKDSNTILKTDVTTQKDSLKDSNTILKALEPIQAEVLKYIMAHPQATREEIADSIDGISFGGVKFIIAKLQKKGLLKRVGGRKHGEWQVLI
ncbi:helix-turn-helix domain-containing protein [Segatella copri]|uniref:helix-turn-helix domain-containing protein n=1 Tax=Segatella copri TaxID=165179 RepID=UPI0029399865|nr:helix-turn-helix domain-containing protein [Segatella copri]MDV3106638.1 helix-turn-helix domain-containing protein [Segatella copri]